MGQPLSSSTSRAAQPSTSPTPPHRTANKQRCQSTAQDYKCIDTTTLEVTYDPASLDDYGYRVNRDSEDTIRLGCLAAANADPLSLDDGEPLSNITFTGATDDEHTVELSEEGTCGATGTGGCIIGTLNDATFSCGAMTVT